jgi:hypothetical protein
MLEQIIHGRLVSDTGAPFLMLVCSRCRTGFRYNYEKRSPAALLPEPPQTPGRVYPIAFSFRAGCVDDNCVSQVELIAIRDAGTTKEQILAEFLNWTLDGLSCENSHLLLFPDPEKSY